MNVHLDCQDKASKCQTKARLLRRQKSTSEIETRIPETNIEDESESINFTKFMSFPFYFLRTYFTLLAYGCGKLLKVEVTVPFIRRIILISASLYKILTFHIKTNNYVNVFVFDVRTHSRYYLFVNFV